MLSSCFNDEVVKCLVEHVLNVTLLAIVLKTLSRYPNHEQPFVKLLRPPEAMWYRWAPSVQCRNTEDVK